MKTEPLTEHQLSTLMAGDRVRRALSPWTSMTVIVSFITDNFIWCGTYYFNKKTGFEIDQRRGWDGVRVSGSVLTEIL